MCGIAGIIGAAPDKAQNALQKMLTALHHRGPDDEGSYIKENIAFGMRRLSIIDIKGGTQPIFAEDGVGVVFNGEIYNYKALRAYLEQKGYHFKTQSDTETLLHLYRDQGLDFVHQLEGMFAICLYDPRHNKLYLIRDRLGKKPLYYIQNTDTFLFSSEIKSLLKGLDQKPIINFQSIHDYLTFRYVPGVETIWEGINSLAPGSILTYDIQNRYISIQNYWALNFNSDPFDHDRDYSQEFETLFLQAVDKRLVASDVPVGILLSGGLDSSAVSAAAVELGHQNFHTFSIGFSDAELPSQEVDRYNELSYAKTVAQHLQSQHHEIQLNQKTFIDFIPELVYHSDQPLADLASIPHFYVSKLASNSVKVVLSGEGSDEILAGYSFDQWAQKLQRLAWIKKWVPSFLLDKIPAYSIQRLHKQGLSNYVKSERIHMTHILNESEKAKLWKHPGNFRPSTDLIDRWYSETKSLHPMDQMQQVYCASWLVEDLLMKADKMSMANSLELRVPFLDHTLVEWAFRLPLEWKVGNSELGFGTKRILREFCKKRLPKSIIQRPKLGFPVPAYLWLNTGLKAFAKESLLGGHLVQYFDPTQMEFLLEDPHPESAHKIWNLIILNQWMERWL